MNKNDNVSNRYKKEQILLFVGIVLLAVAGVANIIRYNWNAIIHLQGVFAGDYRWIWEELHCAFLHIDLTDAVKNQIVIPDVGILHAGVTTVPWSRIMFQFLAPGWLPYHWSFRYFVIVSIVCVSVAWIMTIYKMRDINIAGMTLEQCTFMMVLILLMPFYWADVVCFVNIGVVCVFLILLAINLEDHEVLAGLLMAFTLIKPQDSLPFFVVFLFRKKIKLIFTAGLTTVCSWIVYIFWVNGNPVEQFKQLLVRSESDINDLYFIWYGLCDPLRKLGVSATISMILSMIVGIGLLVAAIWFINKTDLKNDAMIYYMVAGLVSSFWCYKSTSDLVIFVLPSLLVFYYLSRYGLTLQTIVCALIYLGVMNVKIFSAFFRIIFHYEMTLGLWLDAVADLVVFTWMLYMVCKRNEKVNLKFNA